MLYTLEHCPSCFSAKRLLAVNYADVASHFLGQLFLFFVYLLIVTSWVRFFLVFIIVINRSYGIKLVGNIVLPLF